MRKAKDETPKHADVGKVPLEEPDFPNLRAMEQQNLEHHASRAMEAGLPPEQAIEHAKDDAKHWSPKNVEAKPHED